MYTTAFSSSSNILCFFYSHWSFSIVLWPSPLGSTKIFVRVREEPGNKASFSLHGRTRCFLYKCHMKTESADEVKQSDQLCKFPNYAPLFSDRKKINYVCHGYLCIARLPYSDACINVWTANQNGMHFVHNTSSMEVTVVTCFLCHAHWFAHAPAK